MADLWKRSWQKNGWNAIVLDDKDFADHPLRDRFRARVAELPTVNSKEWEIQAFMRYLAYEKVAPGVFTDVDVVNYSIKPEDLIRLPEGEPTIYAYAMEEHINPLRQAANPGLYVANQGGIRAFITDVLHGKPPIDTVRGQPHTSDMYYFFRHAKKHPGRTLCPNAGLVGWETAPAVHWHNSAIAVRFGRKPSQRAEVIQELRPI
jgi:hypothetical protein